MTGRDRFEVIHGDRTNDDPSVGSVPVSRADREALDALAATIAGPEGDDPEVAARARTIAGEILGLPGHTTASPRPPDHRADE